MKLSSPICCFSATEKSTKNFSVNFDNRMKLNKSFSKSQIAWFLIQYKSFPFARIKIYKFSSFKAFLSDDKFFIEFFQKNVFVVTENGKWKTLPSCSLLMNWRLLICSFDFSVVKKINLPQQFFGHKLNLIKTTFCSSRLSNDKTAKKFKKLNDNEIAKTRRVVLFGPSTFTTFVRTRIYQDKKPNCKCQKTNADKESSQRERSNQESWLGCRGDENHNQHRYQHLSNDFFSFFEIFWPY